MNFFEIYVLLLFPPFFLSMSVLWTEGIGWMKDFTYKFLAFAGVLMQNSQERQDCKFEILTVDKNLFEKKGPL